MKKFLIALVAMFGITAGVSAQKTEVYASYGGYTQMDATDCHDGGPSVNTAWGALTAGVNFKITPKYGLARRTHSPAPAVRSMTTTISIIMQLCLTAGMVTIRTT